MMTVRLEYTGNVMFTTNYKQLIGYITLTMYLYVITKKYPCMIKLMLAYVVASPLYASITDYVAKKPKDNHNESLLVADCFDQ